MREGPKKPACFGCPDDLRYSDPIPKKNMGVMMHMGERFCTGGKKARRFKRSDPKITVPGGRTPASCASMRSKTRVNGGCIIP